MTSWYFFFFKKRENEKYIYRGRERGRDKDKCQTQGYNLQLSPVDICGIVFIAMLSRRRKQRISHESGKAGNEIGICLHTKPFKRIGRCACLIEWKMNYRMVVTLHAVKLFTLKWICCCCPFCSCRCCFNSLCCCVCVCLFWSIFAIVAISFVVAVAKI